MGNATAVAPGAGFTGATTALRSNDNDIACLVTFTTATTIPASPYLIFTLTWAGSWSTPYENGPVVLAGACANSALSRTAAQVLAAAALGPFYAIPNALNTNAAIYCTNAPVASTAYDIGFIISQGPW